MLSDQRTGRDLAKDKPQRSLIAALGLE